MYFLEKIYLSILLFLTKFLIKSKIIPPRHYKICKFESKNPKIYILLNNSITDLIILKQSFLQKGLPDPTESFRIKNIKFPQCIFIQEKSYFFSKKTKKLFPSFISLYEYLYKYNSSNHIFSIQIVPVLILFKRIQKKEKKVNLFLSRFSFFRNFKKLLTILYFGRDSFIYISHPFLIKNFLKKNVDDLSIQKFSRLIRITFFRMKFISIGSEMLSKKAVYKKLLQYKVVNQFIYKNKLEKKLIKNKKKNEIKKIIKEIFSNFSYETIRISNKIFTWILIRFRIKLKTYNIKRVQKLAEQGKMIIYLPCHKSHIDYLLISYVLYHQGLALPYIAAGINLNYYFIGSVLKKLGAFFIRRTFKNNRIYSSIFREYLKEILSKGHSLEYFIEGKRSRTGLLLEPQTGILNIIVQFILNKNIQRSISLVPIYIGYDIILENLDYIEELYNFKNKKDRFYHKVINVYKFLKLRKFYINFGNPLLLNQYVYKKNLQIRNSHKILFSKQKYSKYITSIINKTSIKIMTSINSTTFVSPISICSMALLSSSTLLKEKTWNFSYLKLQTDCYFSLLARIPYSKDIILPQFSTEILLENMSKMKFFTIQKNLIFISKKQLMCISFYKNNIQHLFVLFSLTAKIIVSFPGISVVKLKKFIFLIFPLLKREFFLRYKTKEIPKIILHIINELVLQELIEKKTSFVLLYPTQSKKNIFLQNLSNCINETLYKYTIIFFFLLESNPKINFIDLKNKVYQNFYNIDKIPKNIWVSKIIEKKSFLTLEEIIKKEFFSQNKNLLKRKKVKEVFEILKTLIKVDYL